MKKQRGENNFEKHPRKMKGLIVTGASAVAAGVAVWGWFGSAGPTDGITTAPWAVAAREKRTPLSPALFVGQTARAYQVAHDIPHILDQLYCYCECDKHLGHPSLLSCFIDSHAATWVNICQGEALDASQMAEKGYSIDEIRRYVDHKYSRL